MLLLYPYSRLTQRPCINRFTFHYASTLSSDIIRTPANSSKFTFHYASTLSFHPGQEAFREPHLHSTMLLLYQHKEVLKLHSRLIYIPLCFYFINYSTIYLTYIFIYLHSTMLLLYPYIVKSGDCLYNIFTFHYASTLSA